jgi:hypothetical protein
MLTMSVVAEESPGAEWRRFLKGLARCRTQDKYGVGADFSVAGGTTNPKSHVAADCSRGAWAVSSQSLLASPFVRARAKGIAVKQE